MKLRSWQESHARAKMSTFQFDAAPKLREPIIPRNLIDENVVRGIEEDMDPDERLISIFFLIQDYGSRNTYEKLLSNQWTISQFIKENRVEDWEEKLMEILCLIKNYEILLELGINPEDACTKFSTKVPEVPYKVNKYAKAFYSLFESLSKKDAQELLRRVYLTTCSPDLETWPERDSLELHLLWWIQSGFIRIYEDKWSLKNLLMILKELDMSESSIYLTLKNYDFNDIDNDVCHLDHQANSNNLAIRTSNGDKTVADLRKDAGTNKQYQINNGLVVIFNQMNFTGPTEYEYRTGSEVDCRRIVKTFKDKFGFESEIHTDLGQNKIYSVLDGLRFRGKTYDCYVVFVLSHGTYGNIVASDGTECSIETIRSKFCSEALKDKPKILVLQACQKSTLTTDGPKTAQEDLGRFEDFLMLSSTIPGELSVRDSEKGTWFIGILCEALVKEEGRPIEDCLREVNSRFKQLVAKIDEKVIKQVPEHRTTLAKVLVFPWRRGN